MISPKLLQGFKAKSRQIVPVPTPIADVRVELIALIDDYWRFYCNPSDYSYLETRFDPRSGNAYEVHVPGRWRHSHNIVERRDGMTVISIEWQGRFLPLTRKGDQEIVLAVSTPEVVEQILAEIKHAVKLGKLDQWLFRELPPPI
ncbi:MAG: hypothetical protein FJX04_02075 [Alphaproteobacteria bacterium]|nr:hypothetical protein [Alphaproteobacteria bacterium]